MANQSVNTFVILLLLTAPALVSAVQPFAVTQKELAMLPIYCQAKYGKDRGKPTAKRHWQRVFGVENWRHMHHYCDHLKEILRADRSVGSLNERMFHLGKARIGLETSLKREMTRNWILRPEAHVKLGQVLLDMARLKRNPGLEGQAVANFERAIQLKPNYVPPYRALSDYYAKKGQTQKALAIVETGLQYAPNSRSLKRRAKRLSAK